VFAELEALFESLEFEENGVAHIAAVIEGPDDLRVQLHVRFDAIDMAPKVWEFVCADLRTYRLCPEPIESIEFTTEHPLLVPYTAKTVSLNFVGAPVSPNALVGELWQAHQEGTDGWFSFDTFLNPGIKTAELLASGSGILAEGPRPFLDRYATVLKRHGLRIAWVGEREPLEWRDGAWLPEKRDLQALVLGDSYVIGRDWTDAHRITV
jgi:hypothetical protein